MNRRLLRIGAVAAVVGVLAQVAATVLEPDLPGQSGVAIRIVAGNGIWHLDRVLDLVGTFLTVGVLTVVGQTFTDRPARQWARVGQPFLVLLVALGATATATGATVKNLADAWATAAPEAKPAYLAPFYATRQTTDNLFFCAFLALGLYLAALAAAILARGVYARWIGWASAAGAVLVLCGDFLMLAADAAFVAVLAGYAIFNVVVVALGLTMWRQAPHWASTAVEQDADVGPPALVRR
jgi:hypothetical protein